MSGRRTAASRGQRGQATVELALVLPVFTLLVLLLLQVALVVRAQVVVGHAAREGARVAAVDRRPGRPVAAARATPGLERNRVRVAVDRRSADGLVAVTVTYRARTDVPLVGRLVRDPTLTATVVMAVERPEGPPP